MYYKQHGSIKNHPKYTALLTRSIAIPLVSSVPYRYNEAIFSGLSTPLIEVILEEGTLLTSLIRMSNMKRAHLHGQMFSLAIIHEVVYSAP